MTPKRKDRYILYQTMVGPKNLSCIIANEATKQEIEKRRRDAIAFDGIDPGYLYIKRFTPGRRKKRK